VDEGKPGTCHHFKEDGTFSVYKGPSCKGTVDPLLSGKWQTKADRKFAVQRGKEETAQMALVNERSAEKIALSGAISGVLYPVKGGDSDKLIKELETKGVLTLRALPPEMGCKQLGRGASAVRKLKTEAQPRMTRSRDKSLQFFKEGVSDDPKIEKVVWGINQDQIDWAAFHLTADAFGAPGPGGRLEAILGKPKHTASSGKGAKRQQISMWKAYCATLRGAFTKPVDITLFSTPGKKQAYFYVSENIVSSIWDELLAAVNDPANQADDDDDDDAAATPPAKTAPAKAAPPAKTAPAKAAPPPAKKAAPAKTPPAKLPAAKGKPTKGGGLAVPGRDDDI